MTVGQLTKVGQDQAHKLGIFLREEYIDKHKLLSSSYSPAEVRYVNKLLVVLL